MLPSPATNHDAVDLVDKRSVPRSFRLRLEVISSHEGDFGHHSSLSEGRRERRTQRFSALAGSARGFVHQYNDLLGLADLHSAFVHYNKRPRRGS
jgi:hypothetical protein